MWLIELKALMDKGLRYFLKIVCRCPDRWSDAPIVKDFWVRVGLPDYMSEIRVFNLFRIWIIFA